MSHLYASRQFVLFTFLPCLVRLSLSALLFGWVCLVPVGFAQETKPPVMTDSRNSMGVTSPQILYPAIIQREAGSPSNIIYVYENGKHIPVLVNVSLEQVDAIQKLLSQRNPEPHYSILSLTGEGQVTENMASLTLKMRIQTKKEPFIRIPIGLKSGIFTFETDLSQVAQYEGPSQFGFVANPQGNGFDIVLQAKNRLQVSDTIRGEGRGASDETKATLDATLTEFEASSPEDQSRESQVSPSDESSVTADQPTAYPQEVTLAEDELDMRYHIHTVTLKMAFPVTQPSIGEYQWKAEFPAAVSSHVQLIVPQRDAVVMQTKGGNLRQTILSDEQITTFVFQGTSNDFEVRWHEKQHSQLRERVVLQVENGRIIAKVTPTGVLFDATLPVQSSGGTFEKFTLQLPSGAEFRPTPGTETTDYQVEVLPPEQGENSDELPQALRQELLFRLAQPTEGPVTVRVQAETPIHQSQNGWYEVGGLEVMGAEKQFGKLSVIVPQDTRLGQHKESRGIRPGIDATVTDPEGIVTSFEYYEQPCSLLVQAVPQTPRISLGPEFPEYQVQLQRNRAVLRAKLNYTFYGSQKQVAINMKGWRLTNIALDNTVNREPFLFLEDGHLTIPLQEPVGKNVELNFQAERDIDANDGVIDLSFPVPEADDMEPFLVAIIPDNNIELTVDDSLPLVEMNLRSRRDTPLRIELPVRQQGALVYQIDHPDEAKYCAKTTLQQQRISVQSHTELTLQSDEPAKQTLDYLVEYEPVPRLTLAVPAELDAQGDLRVVCDSLEMNLFTMSEMAVPGITPSGVVLKQVRLPDAKIGKFQLTLEFKLTNQIREDFAQNLTTSTVQVKVPVVLPHEGQLVKETVRVRHPQGLQLTHDDVATGWKKTESRMTPATSLRSESVYQTESATPLLSLGAALKNTDRTGTMTVEKGWVRSWLLGTGRVDYACYRISTNMSHLTVRLPDHVRTDGMIVKVDDRTVKLDDRTVMFNRKDCELTIPLMADANDSVSVAAPQLSPAWLDLPDTDSIHTVEIWYEVTLATSVNHLTLDMPSFRPSVIVRPTYCQVILPNSRHLLACHPAWMPQYRWRWDGGFFARKPDVTQLELEDWIGVAHGEPISPTLNNYLFMTFHPESKVPLDIVDRSTLILISSGLVLMLGLILIYFPRIRYPGVLFTFLVLLIAAFAYRTTFAVLFLQAGTIGVVLSLIAVFLYRLFVIADPWRGMASGSLAAVGMKDRSRFVPPDVSTDEHHSDDAVRKRIASSDREDSVCHDSGKTDALPANGEANASLRKYDDAVQEDDTNVTDAPQEQERNGHV